MTEVVICLCFDSYLLVDVLMIFPPRVIDESKVKEVMWQSRPLVQWL